MFLACLMLTDWAEDGRATIVYLSCVGAKNPMQSLLRETWVGAVTKHHCHQNAVDTHSLLSCNKPVAT